MLRGRDLANVDVLALEFNHDVELQQSSGRARWLINRVLGLGLIGLVVAKLYLYDVWLLVRIYRIAAFAVLGALLLITSYLYSRYKEKIETWWKDDKALS